MRRTKPTIHTADFSFDPGFLLEDGSSGCQDVSISFTEGRLTQDLRHPESYAGSKDLNYEYRLSPELMGQITHLLAELDINWWPKEQDRRELRSEAAFWQVRITYDFDDFIKLEDREAAPEQLIQLQELLNEQLQPSYPIILVEMIQPSLAVIRQAEADIPVHAARREQEWDIISELIEGFTPRIKARLGLEFKNDRQEELFNFKAEMALRYFTLLDGEMDQWDEVRVTYFGRQVVPFLVQEYQFYVNDIAEFFCCYLTLLVEDQQLTPGKSDLLSRAFCTGILSYYELMEERVKDGQGSVEELKDLLLTYRFKREA